MMTVALAISPPEWLAATRPRTLVAAVVPVLLGLSLARRAGPLDLPLGLATLAAAVLIQIATNFANDYFDGVKGADGGNRLGPVRMSQRGGEVARAMRRATLAAMGLAALIGLYLIARGGWPILTIGALALAAAVAYTGGPFPLAYHGLGDVFVFVFFGPVAVCGTYLLQRGAIGFHTLLAAVPVGCVATAILVVNNLRDIPSDAGAGKRTLAVRLGPRRTRAGYVALLAAAFVVAAVAGHWLALAALPLAALEVRLLYRRDGRALNASLAGTARLHLVFGLLLAAGGPR
jgi:1,4-dihydroxy-2-naphthoate octaprenyltransferase